jgi:hypothetical protein
MEQEKVDVLGKMMENYLGSVKGHYWAQSMEFERGIVTVGPLVEFVDYWRVAMKVGL